MSTYVANAQRAKLFDSINALARAHEVLGHAAPADQCTCEVAGKQRALTRKYEALTAARPVST